MWIGFGCADWGATGTGAEICGSGRELDPGFGGLDYVEFFVGQLGLNVPAPQLGFVGMMDAFRIVMLAAG